MIKVGSDFSGVGAFNQALNRLQIDYKEVFACDMDKYARQTFIHNYGEPEYYPENVYDREIPKDPLTIYMTSPPCQSFSLAGKRKGKDSENGILFFNSYQFIQENKPRYFIFENVKGLLSDDNGKTFSEWVNMLGGKSVNGNPVLFPYEDSVPYHLYWKVLNAKNYGVPQNRERIFLIGVREDEDNTFRFPKEAHLTKRLKDVLENEVDEKYFLSENQINKVLETLDNDCNEPKIIGYTRDEKGKVIKRSLRDTANTIHSSTGSGNNTDQFMYRGAALRTRDDEKGKNKRLELRNDDLINALTSHHTDSLILHNLYGGFNEDEPRIFTEYSPTIRTAKGGGHIPSTIEQSKIRRLTPRECFRLMDFPDTFDFSVVSNSQAYKQAGNSIVVKCLELIIDNLDLTNESKY